MLGCLGGRTRPLARGEVIFAAGQPGGVRGHRALGRGAGGEGRFLRATAPSRPREPGELFGEAFACAGVERLPVTVEGAAPGQVLLIQLQRIMEPCCNACAFHNRMVLNLLRVMAARNLQLNQKLEITSHRTTREKLMAYLMTQARQARSSSFTIPFDRQGAGGLPVRGAQRAVGGDRAAAAGGRAGERASHFKLLTRREVDWG